jgi:hypothetical protein
VTVASPSTSHTKPDRREPEKAQAGFEVTDVFHPEPDLLHHLAPDGVLQRLADFHKAGHQGVPGIAAAYFVSKSLSPLVMATMTTGAIFG